MAACRCLAGHLNGTRHARQNKARMPAPLAAGSDGGLPMRPPADPAPAADPVRPSARRFRGIAGPAASKAFLTACPSILTRL